MKSNRCASKTEENKHLAEIEQSVKHIRYEYDLISGNVKAVHYQEGEFDEFHHGYLYDADNRVTTTYTWRGPLLSPLVESWEKEQKNFYYLTGPLQRQEIGDKTVQAMDYAYTAQGWIKVMNAGSISSNRDMGRDAYSENIAGAASTNMYTGLDASGFVLNYFTSHVTKESDYWAPAITTAGTANSYLPRVTSTATRADYHNLYNGNIESMVTSLTDQSETIIDNQLTAYQYDQLNRIKQVRAHRNYDNSTNAFAGSSGNDGKYEEDFVFDRNGNIITVERNGNNTGGTQLMDDFTYYYYDQSGTSFGYAGAMPINGTNKLAYVDDSPTITGNYSTDIDDQATDNYEYDGNGNLVKDPSEEIDNIEWYANGKIKKITRESTSSKSDLEFIYDASGNRIIKITRPRDGTGVLSQLHWTITYYVRDASGNVMAVYERTFREDEGENDIFYDDFKNAELHIYGSKRVGTNNVDSTITFPFEDADFVDSYGDYFDQPDYDPITSTTPCTSKCKTNHRRELGNKQYEVTNHLGNVLATVSDRRLSEDSYSYTAWTSGTKYAYDAIRNIYYQNGSGTFERTASSDNKADFYTADVISYSDYYAYGAQMDGRNGGTKYRYDFNGKETDMESDLQDYGMRIYNARLGRFLSVDPITAQYPMLTPYQFASNTPIWAVDLDGLEAFFVHGVWSGTHKMNNPDYARIATSLEKYTNNFNFDYSFDWQRADDGKKINGALYNSVNLDLAANLLVHHILDYRKEEKIVWEEITLIGFSGGGIVALRAARTLYDMGYKVNMILYNTPAYNTYGDKDSPFGNPAINDLIMIQTEHDGVRGLWSNFDRYYDKAQTPANWQSVRIKSTANTPWGRHFAANGSVSQIEYAGINRLDPVKEGKATNDSSYDPSLYRNDIDLSVNESWNWSK